MSLALICVLTWGKTWWVLKILHEFHISIYKWHFFQVFTPPVHYVIQFWIWTACDDCISQWYVMVLSRRNEWLLTVAYPNGYIIYEDPSNWPKLLFYIDWKFRHSLVRKSHPQDILQLAPDHSKITFYKMVIIHLQNLVIASQISIPFYELEVWTNRKIHWLQNHKHECRHENLANINFRTNHCKWRHATRMPYSSLLRTDT